METVKKKIKEEMKKIRSEKEMTGVHLESNRDGCCMLFGLFQRIIGVNEGTLWHQNYSAAAVFSLVKLNKLLQWYNRTFCLVS